MKEMDIRETDPMGRFEIICELFIDGDDKVRETILEALEPDERQTFLKGVGLYRMFRDDRYYKAVQQAVGEQFMKEAKA